MSTRAPGYHLNGTETISASWPRARSSVDERVLKISAPPWANGTCGLQTAILTAAGRPCAPRGSRPDSRSTVCVNQVAALRPTAGSRSSRAADPAAGHLLVAVGLLDPADDEAGAARTPTGTRTACARAR